MRKPKLLFVWPFLPHLTSTGAPMRAGMQIVALAKIFDVTLAIVSDCIGDVDVEALLSDEVRNVCASIIVVDRVGTVERLLRCVHSLQLQLILEALWPFPRWYTTMGPALNALATQLAGQHFDVVHCSRLRTGRLSRLMKRHGIAVDRLVLDLDDYESQAIFRSVRPLVRVIGRQLAAARWLEAVKWVALEKLLIPRFDDVCVCSVADQAKLGRRFPRNRWHVLPNVAAEPPRAAARGHDPFTFLFVGQLSYPPNTDAVVFFCERILPLLRERAPGPFRVLIVGRHPGRLARLGSLANVEVIGNPPDVAPYYARSDAAVVPLRAGGGTRIKILEAFSHGIPVVSTTIGAEGLDVTPGADILVADDPESFAEQCRRLLTDEPLRRRIAAAGRLLWQRKYSPAALDAALAAIYLGQRSEDVGEIAAVR